MKNWDTIATVALTAVTTILAGVGVVTSDEATQLATTGAAAATGLASFAAALAAVVRAHRKGKKDGVA